ncbi:MULTISPECIES: hypothetical protein [unclassified Streptomyces]|uniref:hypothetical protein n=1 Tax=unclassified Streptomyces TaxID=2593676 RepID=UPI0021C8944E|nr:hypothetical protein [Streptomyces sp. FIT100]UUN26122.1 hypothetical protein KK483_06600 [Streptomyces sp. FIT100]
MSARTHTRSHAPAAGGVDIRLPWWALVLPVLGFALLLVLMSTAGDAQAATGDPSVGFLLDRIQTLTGS